MFHTWILWHLFIIFLSSFPKLHLHFPNKSLLKIFRSLKPNHPSSFSLHILSYLTQAIFLLSCSQSQRKSLWIFITCFSTLTDTLNNDRQNKDIPICKGLIRVTIPTNEMCFALHLANLYLIFSYHSLLKGVFLWLPPTCISRYVNGRSMIVQFTIVMIPSLILFSTLIPHILLLYKFTLSPYVSLKNLKILSQLEYFLY